MADILTAERTASGVEELLRLKAEYLVPCVYHFYKDPPQIVAGDGPYLFDATGRRYLDCFSGVTVMSAGHCNPAITEAAIAQIRTLQHTTSIYLTEPVLRLAERLAEVMPGELRRSFFCASGSEAVEGALLLAMLHTGRREVVAMRHGLHGRTRWAMNATGLDMWRTDPFPLDSVHHVPFDDIATIESLLRERGDRIAAVIAEPVQGNGGIVVPADDYWPAVRTLCERFGVLLVHDEIQTGFNRTGRWLAVSRWGVTPDIVTLSKAIGNGFPIAAFMTTDAIARSYTRPGASTYGGNPVSAAAALATIDYHESLELGRASEDLGRIFLGGLRLLANSTPHLVRPRGLGLMAGVEVVDADGSPDPARLDRILERLKDLGYLAGKTGPNRNVLSFLPPLIVTPEQIGGLIHALYESIRD